MYNKIIVVLVSFFLYFNVCTEKKSFVVVTASFNNIQWFEKNLSSVFQQDYEEWRMIYIDDCSTDGTAEAVKHYISAHGMDHKVSVIVNLERSGHLINQYKAIHSCRDDEIIIILDGDDWLAFNGVFSLLNLVYQNPNVWITYGSYKTLKHSASKCVCEAIPESIIQQNGIRKYKWVASHLRTFYAELYKKILMKDLLYQGAYFPACVDLATMFPMLEMAGHRHRFVSDVLVIYNNASELNFHARRDGLQNKFGKIIRNMPRYKLLSGLTCLKDKSILDVNFQDSLLQYNKSKISRYLLKCKRKNWYADFFKKLERIYAYHKSKKFVGSGSIPKIIHQIWLGSDLPEKYKIWQKTWQDLHPDWTYFLWTDENVKDLEMYNQDLFDASKNYGERSDLLRIELLYRYGGVYVDMDFACLKSLDVLHENYDFYVGLVPLDSIAVLANGVIGSKPNHPILRSCMENIRSMWAGKSILERGPMYFEKIVYDYLLACGSEDPGFIALPPTFFFPITHERVREQLSKTGARTLPLEQIKALIRPESLAIHFWSGSWSSKLATVI